MFQIDLGLIVTTRRSVSLARLVHAVMSTNRIQTNGQSMSRRNGSINIVRLPCFLAGIGSRPLSRLASKRGLNGNRDSLGLVSNLLVKDVFESPQI